MEYTPMTHSEWQARQSLVNECAAEIQNQSQAGWDVPPIEPPPEEWEEWELRKIQEEQARGMATDPRTMSKSDKALPLHQRMERVAQKAWDLKRVLRSISASLFLLEPQVPEPREPSNSNPPIPIEGYVVAAEQAISECFQIAERISKEI